MKRLLGIVCLLLAWPVLAQEWPAGLTVAMQRAKLPTDALSFVIMPLDASAPARESRADEPRNPASLMKLLTTHAALDVLGPDWQWQTELRALALPQHGVLASNLYLKGSGDPSLTLERLWLLLRELKLQGVREIRGDLVLDRSLFVQNGAAAAFDDDGNSPERPYLVTPDAALINFKSLRLLFDSRGDTVRVQFDPALPEIRIENHVQTDATGDCVQWRQRVQMQVEDRGNQATLRLTGRMPAGCRGERYLAVLEHPVYAASILRTLWQEMGGTWQGGMRLDTAPGNAAVIATVRSPELPLIVRDINKHSNNVMARQLFLTLGAVTGGGDVNADTAAQSVAVMERWLTGKGWYWPELNIDNGAGLSRDARITAHHLAMLLQDAGRGPLAPEFIASLPLVAVDGTMKKRLQNEPLAGQAHVKTGSLRGVRAIAGFVRAADSRLHIVVAIINHERASAGQEVLDEVLRMAHAGGVATRE